jgi:epoxyqueuosine reductase
LTVADQGILAAIREAAAAIGFVSVGVARAEPFARGRTALFAWLQAGRHGEMRYMAKHRSRHDPRALLAGARSILVVALAHPRSRMAQRSPDTGYVAAYARGNDYHVIIRQKLAALAEACAEVTGGPVTARPCVDTAPLLEREAAAAAGVGFIGKSTMLIVPGVGSNVLLGELLVDVDLVPGEPMPSRCGDCTACLDACPTRAFCAPYELDAQRCISYSTIELRGPIPRDLRAEHGAHLFGCDVCQDVCPFNASSKARDVEPQLQPRDALESPRAEDWLALGSSGYRRLVAGTALRRSSRNQLARNAAVVLGNRAAPDSVPSLRRALSHHASPLVRGHAAWALGRVGNVEARRALTEARQSESDATVVEEIRLALEAPG